MPQLINYAEKWQNKLLPFIGQDTITGEHIETKVKWTGARTFHFTLNQTSGYKNHSRDGGWNKGKITQTDIPFTINHDRDISFYVDKADVDESNMTASAKNITNTFMVTQSNPEKDAYFFSSVASHEDAQITQDEVVGVDITEENVVRKLKKAIKPLRKYGVKNIRGYISSDVMELLELAENFKKEIKVQVVNTGANGEKGEMLETRVTHLDGVKLIEVEDADRFYDSFDYEEGFKPVAGVSRALNYLFCTITHSMTVPKISSVYLREPHQHEGGDGYLYQNRSMWDVFNFPNAKTGEVDSITGSSGTLV